MAEGESENKSSFTGGVEGNGSSANDGENSSSTSSEDGRIKRIIARLKQNGLQAEQLHYLQCHYLDTLKTDQELATEVFKEGSEPKDPFEVFAEFLKAHPKLAMELSERENFRGSLDIIPHTIASS